MKCQSPFSKKTQQQKKKKKNEKNISKCCLLKFLPSITVYLTCIMWNNTWNFKWAFFMRKGSLWIMLTANTQISGYSHRSLIRVAYILPCLLIDSAEIFSGSVSRGTIMFPVRFIDTLNLGFVWQGPSLSAIFLYRNIPWFFTWWTMMDLMRLKGVQTDVGLRCLYTQFVYVIRFLFSWKNIQFVFSQHQNQAMFFLSIYRVWFANEMPGPFCKENLKIIF